MTTETVNKVEIPYYETQILSGEPEQLNDWAIDLVGSLQGFVDDVTEKVNLMLNSSNSDATYWGTLDELGDWNDGTWRLIRVSANDFQLQKKIDGVFTKNAKWAE